MIEIIRTSNGGFTVITLESGVSRLSCAPATEIAAQDQHQLIPAEPKKICCGEDEQIAWTEAFTKQFSILNRSVLIALFTCLTWATVIWLYRYAGQ